jgi:hypothetical protein
MSKHTPGPWEAVYVGSSDWDLNGPVTEQDWKLAAAAPELLEALKEMLEVWEEDPAYGSVHAEKARAAIARAEGKV